jgi:NAD+ synthase (glutamine-hydrolysing)
MHAERRSDIRLSLVSLNQTPLDWKGNTERILSALEALKSVQPAVVLFPELCIPGYGCEDQFYAPYVADKSIQIAQHIAQKAAAILPDTLVVCGIPVRYHERIFNCAAVLLHGKIQALIPKQNLAGDGIHYEQRWFTAWRQPAASLAVNGQPVPIGPVVLDFAGTRIAFEICEDAWVPNRPADKYTSFSPDLILCPSASHFAFGKQNTRRNIATESSRAYSCAYAMINLAGNEAGRAIYDGSALVAQCGNLLYEGRRFSFADFSLNTVDIDLESIRAQKGRFYSYKEQEEETGYDVLPLHAAALHGADLAPGAPSEEPLSREEEMLRAVTLGLFDYMRKSHSRGFVISLSGGADSAACAVLVQRMLVLSARELGLSQALRRLGRSDLEALLPSSGQGPADGQTLVLPHLLQTIYQGTRQSSDTTRNAARAVADACSASHHEVDVEDIVKRYVTAIEGALGRTFSWEKDDLALQNIQARARSPMAWLLANAERHILITTSNRSEGSAGYCTMDGDTSGGLAPIAGVDKAYLREWLIWLEKTGDAAGGKMPALAFINQQEPTAELKPGQTDERDLMPYVLLDSIEALAIRDKKHPSEILQILLKEGRFSREVLTSSIQRFFRLWTQNQWKRERLAPSFHLDDRNVDPRTWCRFPILSGGFEEELREMMEE